MNIVEVENLVVRYRESEVLSNINLVIKPGEIAVIIGPNGSGKTTLLKAILGIVGIHKGHAHLFGHPSSKLSSKERKKVGYVGQRVEIDRTFPVTVQEYLRLMFLYERVPKEEQDAAIHKALKKVGADKLYQRKLGELSGGEFQRVLVARAIIHEPQVLFLDEPTTGIDVGGEETLYKLVSDLRKSEQMTLVMVSHDLNVVYKYADNVICVNKELVCYGRPEEALNPESLAKLYGKGIKVYEHTHDHEEKHA